MALPAAQQENLMDLNVNAHLKVEMVLNDDYAVEYDDEIRFNDIICYDSGEDSNDNGTDQNDTNGISSHDINFQNQRRTSEISFNSQSLVEKDVSSQKKSNAEQMRKYRAKQRSDPVRYQQYLERERMRNHKRKCEKRIKAAQQKAIELGLPYIVLEQFSSEPRRGRRPKYPREEAFLPIKFDHADPNLFQMDTYDGIPIMPVEVQLTESDEAYREQKPHISVVNIDKLMNPSRPALQTLLPQEVNDRECVNNYIKLDHDYVKIKTEPTDEYSYDSVKMSQHSTSPRKRKSNKINRDELLKLQEQCQGFIYKNSYAATPSNNSHRATNPLLRKSKSSRRSNKVSKHRTTFDSMQNDPIADSVEHEDFDDLFKELEEVANKEQPKKVKSSKTSPSKQHGHFSLTVCMPVQPMIASKSGSVHSEKSTEHSNSDFVENVKKEPVSSDDDFGF